MRKMWSKKFEFFTQKVAVSIIFRIFAVPNLRGSMPNYLSLNALRGKVE